MDMESTSYRGEPLSYWERVLARCERNSSSKLERFHNSILKDELCSSYMEEISYIVGEDFDYVEVPTNDDLEFDSLFKYLFDYQRNLLIKYLKQEAATTKVRRIVKEIKNKRG